MSTIQILSSQIRSGKLNPCKVAADAIAEAIVEEFALEWDEAESLASQVLAFGRDWATVKRSLREIAC